MVTLDSLNDAADDVTLSTKPAALVLFNPAVKLDFPRAREARLQISGNPSQYDDLEPFLREQDLLRRLAAESLLPVLELDISDDDLPRAADRVADWLEATGGLTLA